MKKIPKEPRPPIDSKPTPSLKASISSTGNPSKWIRTEHPIALPDPVRQAIARLTEAGFEAYIVGGSVRDALLGRAVKDHDIATSASPDEIVQLFPQAIEVGKAFGVIKVPTAGVYGGLLEIATFREDLAYEDHRHPTAVRFTGAVEDARRRDFTVNALFYDPRTQRILDTVNGVEDLRGGVLRAIGVPSERFHEDALRLLRAVRFTTQLGFALEIATSEAVRLRASLITKVSAERVREELDRMWTGPRPGQALDLLLSHHLLEPVVPELARLRGVPESPLQNRGIDVWRHTTAVIDRLAALHPARSQALGWAAVLHEIGKPAAAERSGGKNFNGHEIDGARLALVIADRLRFSREQAERMAFIIEVQGKFGEAYQMREATLQRFVREPGFADALALHQAIALASDGNLAYHDFLNQRYVEVQAARLAGETRLLTGEDLIQLGFKPGPTFSDILREVEDLALERRLASKEEALEYVVKRFVN